MNESNSREIKTIGMRTPAVLGQEQDISEEELHKENKYNVLMAASISRV
jgi:hypothetical protein